MDAELPAEEAPAKAPKDRSALVGLKRTRKSRDQIYQLQKLYEESKGKPTKAQLKNLAKDSGLKLQQVYKWYWDTEKKNNKLQSVLEKDERNIRSPQRISRKIMKTQYTDEFGGYSKTWFADGLDQVKNSEEIDMRMMGEAMDEHTFHQEIPEEPAAQAPAAQDYGMDCLARHLGLDIEALARDLAMNNDGRKPIQCIDVDEDDEEEEKEDATMVDAPAKSSHDVPLLKVQKVEDGHEDGALNETIQDELARADSFMQGLGAAHSAADFDKNSRQMSFKSGHSGLAGAHPQQKAGEPRHSTPCHPLKEISPGLRQRHQNAHSKNASFFANGLQNPSGRPKKESPILVPNVIRPGQSNQPAQNGATKGTPQSVVSRASYASKYNSPYNNAQVLGKNTKFTPVGVNSGRIVHNKAQLGASGNQRSQALFTTPSKNNQGENGQCADKDIASAFYNLFKGPSNENVMGGIMQTPSFFDSQHPRRAAPLNANKQGQNNQPGETPSGAKDQASAKNRRKEISSVFSPIPCKPQSVCSIFGVRGDNNTPYSPFDRGAQDRPTPKKSPINTEKILRQVAQATQGRQE